jgi:thiol-disulfide isomerase/thioredoxin
VKEAFVSRRSLRFLVNVLAPILIVGISSAQSPQVLPACEPSPEIRKIVHDKLSGAEFDKLKFSEQTALQRAVYEDLIVKYPREVVPYNCLIRSAREYPGEFPDLEERFRKLAVQNPDDPLSLYVSGHMLFGTDTPKSLQLIETAKSTAPQFPAPLLLLANAYAYGKRMDRNKSLENLAAYFAVCPASTDSSAQRLLAEYEDLALRQKVDTALRASLAKETDPKRLRDYQILWSLEFRMHPPQEHDSVRQRVTEDLKRLESINPKPDSEWTAFLILGYRQAGASTETITTMQDRLLRDFPHSMEAYDIVSDRWEMVNKNPADQKDAVAWANYRTAREVALKGWIRDFPDLIPIEEWFPILMEDDSLSEKDGTAALDDHLRYKADHDAPHAWVQFQAANFLLNHHWQPNRALDLLEQCKAESEKERASRRPDDNLTSRDADTLKQQDIGWDIWLDGQILKAAMLARRPEALTAIKGSVEGPAPADEGWLSSYWGNRARLSLMEGRKEDAVAYYQLALQTRTETPQYSRGKLQDDIGDEARTLWKEMGGTLAAWSVWSRPAAATGQKQGDWEKAKKELPAFEISDLSGKTWRLRELNGKVLLINVWATWCGPCKAELSELQKLYEQVKGRSDIQLLAFDTDDDIGLVAPFLKDKGYTFPVVPAHSLVSNLLEENVFIPQSWIVDAKGTWRWTQMGFADRDSWVPEMIQKLESAKAND